jgi:hypothetical protein
MKNLTAGTLGERRRSRLELHGNAVRVATLDIVEHGLGEYLSRIPEDKRETAFIHVVRVGIAEIRARRASAHAVHAAQRPKAEPPIDAPGVERSGTPNATRDFLARLDESLEDLPRYRR